MSSREAVRERQRQERFLQALDSADLDQDAAERVADVRDAYLNGHIDKQELEQRLEGAVANDNCSELSDRDASVARLIAEVAGAALLVMFVRVADLEIKSPTFGTNQWNIRAAGCDSPAEAAGRLQTLLSLGPFFISLFFAALADLLSSDVVILPALIVISVFLLSGIVSDLPEVRVHTPGRGDHVAD